MHWFMRFLWGFVLVVSFALTVFCLGANAKTRHTKPIMMFWDARQAPDDADTEHLDVEVLYGLESILHVYKNDRLIFRFKPGLCISKVFQLDDGNLATVWHGGTGSYQKLYIFGFQHGRVKQLIEAGSQMNPEIAYLSDGPLYTTSVQDRNGKWKLKGGPWAHQAIIVPNVKWATNSTTNKEEWRPITADIYELNWKTGKYDVKKNVPWTKRFGKYAHGL